MRSLLLPLVAALALAGCSSSATGPSAAAPPAGPATTATAGDCGGTAGAVRDHLGSADVVRVTVDGQCTDVVIDTGLADDDTTGGRHLCETAGEVAYTGDINSVTVRARSGAELSVGIVNMKCLP
jgi:hypothetical protein